MQNNERLRAGFAIIAQNVQVRCTTAFCYGMSDWHFGEVSPQIQTAVYSRFLVFGNQIWAYRELSVPWRWNRNWMLWFVRPREWSSVPSRMLCFPLRELRWEVAPVFPLFVWRPWTRLRLESGNQILLEGMMQMNLQCFNSGLSDEVWKQKRSKKDEIYSC